MNYTGSHLVTASNAGARYGGRARRGLLASSEGAGYDPRMTLTLDVTAELEHQVVREARRKGLDPKGFILGLLRDYLASQAPSITQIDESELLEEINRGFPAEHWKRYEELVTKRRAETLTDDEHAEMLAMIQLREEANVHRVECLAELAKRRQVPLRELMDQMGIVPTIDA